MRNRRKKKKKPEILFPASNFNLDASAPRRNQHSRKENIEGFDDNSLSYKTAGVSRKRTKAELELLNMSFTMYPCDCKVLILSDDGYTCCPKCLMSSTARVTQVKSKI